MPRRISLTIAACLLGVAAQAPGENVPLTAEQRAFVDRYVDAVRAKDVAKQKALVHPKSLECIKPESADFYDDVFASRLAAFGFSGDGDRGGGLEVLQVGRQTFDHRGIAP